jgi:hypothetical protein
MIDMTEFERECLEKTLVPLSEYLMEQQALSKTIATLPRATVLGMAEVIITAYQEHMTAINNKVDEGAPF